MFKFDIIKIQINKQQGLTPCVTHWRVYSQTLVGERIDPLSIYSIIFYNYCNTRLIELQEGDRHHCLSSCFIFKGIDSLEENRYYSTNINTKVSTNKSTDFNIDTNIVFDITTNINVYIKFNVERSLNDACYMR
ncbi:hypothetical protein COC69_01145 [Bacillus cereus]|uniref:Uncharacterized protein n=1 Tax=Bacillus cereus TaxID=1396 RepID=A0A9X7GY48_BACCE|nr:hypothetical protein COC69_01145 [Bacillus cereus]